jgi:hypothetical protein
MTRLSDRAEHGVKLMKGAAFTEQSLGCVIQAMVSTWDKQKAIRERFISTELD